MIEFLRGTLISKQPHRLVLETNGVAFEVFIPFSTFKALGDPGHILHLLCHLHWREEGPQIFGFLTETERDLFRLLIRVNKVGPKLAANIMSAGSPEKLVEMIMTADTHGLTALKGIGEKLASRLVVELKDLVSRLGIGEGVKESAQNVDKIPIPHREEVREALENLGYTAREIENAFRAIAPNLRPESGIQEVLEIILRSFSA